MTVTVTVTVTTAIKARKLGQRMTVTNFVTCLNGTEAVTSCSMHLI
jgi:hypothetical protein